MVGYEEALRGTLELLRRHLTAPCDVLPTDLIVKDLGLDSLGVMELVADVETRFGVSIPSDVFDGISTVADLARAVTKLQRP